MSLKYDRDNAALRLYSRLLLVHKTGCIEFQGCKYPSGHGQFHFRSKGKKRATRAHRVAWELKNGPIPEGMNVLHHCDNPACCNVEHLFLGTITDNNLDMIAKGRGNNQKKTHCPRGHAYTEDNTKHYTEHAGRHNRYCRECQKMHNRAYRARQRMTEPYVVVDDEETNNE